ATGGKPAPMDAGVIVKRYRVRIAPHSAIGPLSGTLEIQGLAAPPSDATPIKPVAVPTTPPANPSLPGDSASQAFPVPGAPTTAGPPPLTTHLPYVGQVVGSVSAEP